MNEQDRKRAAKRILSAHPLAGRHVPSMMRLLERCALKGLRPGARVCAEGDPAEAMWFLLRGQVRVFALDDKGERRELGRMGKPMLFGHVGLVGGRTRSATCVAASDVLLAELDRALYERLLASPKRSGVLLRRLLLSAMSTQLALTSRRLERAIDEADLEPETDLVSQLAGSLGGWSDEEMRQLQEIEVVRQER